MLNHITLMGRLTRDPEIRYTSTNTPVVSFTVACDRDFGGKDGQERQVDFIDCVAWRSTAEFISKFFQKGTMAVISGRLQIRDWTDRDNNKRRSAEIVVDNIYFGEKKRDREDNGTAGGNTYSRPSSDNQDVYRRYEAAPSGNAFAELNDSDGELPF